MSEIPIQIPFKFQISVMKESKVKHGSSILTQWRCCIKKYHWSNYDQKVKLQTNDGNSFFLHTSTRNAKSSNNFANKQIKYLHTILFELHLL